MQAFVMPGCRKGGCSRHNGEILVMMGAVVRGVAVGSLFLALTCLYADSARAAGVFRVNANSTAETPDGSSWENAFKTLQEGADAANAAGGGDVWVAKGYYTGTRSPVINMTDGVSLYGGFSGTESSATVRDWSANACIIDGENKAQCVSSSGNGTLNGFIITRGKYSLGGGLRISGILNVANCVFMNNTADRGGAIYNTGSPSVVNCVFKENQATPTSDSYDGGGAVYTYTSSTTQQPNFTHCTFSANHAQYGGAIHNRSKSFKVTNCILYGDRASYGPEIYDYNASGNYISVTYSCIETGYTGVGNISLDPMFVDPEGRDSVQLRAGSPCLNRGYNGTSSVKDFFGRWRTEDAAPDLGAYEGGIDPYEILTLDTAVSPAEAGRISPETATTHHFALGDVVPLWVEPLGYRFDRWGGSLDDTRHFTSIRMTSNALVTANLVENIVRVNVAHTGSEDGATWQTAYRTIAAGMDAVGANGGEIWVARGVYTGNGGTVLTMRAGTFLYGGFAGQETTREQRDLEAGDTILNGEGLNRCVNGASDAVLDGFTIVNGHATYAAGICNISVSPTIANCTILGNNAWFGAGGGIYNSNSRPRMTNCVIARNESYGSGGGMYSYSSSPELVNCTIAGNHGSYFGGTADLSSTVTLTNCILWDNSTSDGLDDYSGVKSLAAAWSCIQGGGAGTGDIGVDPLFVDSGGGSLQLRTGSPCAGAANASFAPSRDRLGRYRLSSGPATMGAYERTVTTTDIVRFSVQSFPENAGYVFPAPGSHYFVRGESVPVSAKGVGMLFSGWTGALESTAPQASVLMDGPKHVTAVFSENIIRVNAASEAAAPDGASWPMAFRSLQEGIRAAAGGGQVWVAAGTYTPDRVSGITMEPAVFVCGGFAGTETELSQRDWHARKTIIDGEDSKRCLWAANDALLDGFTVTRGRGDNANDNSGAGILAYNVTFTAKNCLFSGNQAAGGGGAIFSNSAQLTVEDCRFQKNSAISPPTGFMTSYYTNTAGGAIAASSGIALLSRCCFIANTTSGIGGAFTYDTTGFSMENCVFQGNHAQHDGGAIGSYYGYLYGYGQERITNCTFSGNTAGRSGGGLAYLSPYTRLTNSILWDNRDGNGDSQLTFSYTNLEQANVLYSCIKGGYPGTGNISQDPLFLDGESGSLQLQSGSPCLDAGLSDGAPTTDLLGHPRPSGNGVDMGAYEGSVSVEDTVELTIAVLPEGSGRTVPSAGVHRYPRGTTAVIYAEAVGCRLTRWTGAVESNAPGISVVMDDNKTITAEFEPFVAYVNGAAVDNGGGASWEDACNSLQTAVDTVAAGGGGEVWVAAGNYTATTNPVLTMRPGVFLYGGFSGTETERSQRDWAKNVTTINGEDGRRCVVGADDALLDGFVVTRGAGLDRYGQYDDGGGMYNYGVSPTVAHCTFLKNVGQNGGGMHNEYASPSITDCSFLENYSSEYPADYGRYCESGGGICVEVGAPIITRCLFRGNVAAFGAGIANIGGNPTIIECTFRENVIGDAYNGSSSPCGGGGVCNVDASATLRSCLFDGNRLGGYYHQNKDGGGILNTSLDYEYAPPYLEPPQIRVENCVFRENTVGGDGGGVCSRVPYVTVMNCTFQDNVADYGSSIYYGQYYYSYLQYVLNTQPRLVNCVIHASNADSQPCVEDYFSTDPSRSLLVTHSCITGGYAGTGNIDADPQYANPDYGDLRLSAGSPCIDAGTAEDAPPVDFLGIPRPQGAGFDMGAYEYDAMPPNAPVVSGPDSITNNTRPSFNWVSGDTTGAGHYRCGFAEGLWIVQDGTDLSFTPASDLSDGRYVFYVQERDASGNWSASGSYTLVVDTIAPYAPVVGGADSPSANPRPAWAWGSGGGGGNRLFRFGFAEDTWIAESVAEVNFTPPGNLDDGEHTLYVQERDAAGNWSPSGAFAITVDTTPPNPPVVNGIPSPTANTRPVWSWVSGGNDGDGRFRMGFEEGVWLAENVTFTGYVPTDGLPDGPHTLFVQERDTAGNWSVSGSFAVTVDTTPPGAPVVGVRLPSPTSARPAWAWVPCGADGAGLFRFGYAEGMWLAADSPAVTFTPDTDLADGPHTLFVQERDMAGNWGPSGSVTVTVNTVVYHSVTVQPAAGGTVTLEPVQPEGGYPQGTVVTVTAAADADHTFTGWNGDLSGTANPATLTVDNDKTLGALFTEKPAEGEGEGETPPPSLDEAAQQLTDAFTTTDTDGDGALSEVEARAAVPGLTAAQFAQIDADGNGQITRDELGAVLNPDAGCGCRSKKDSFILDGLKRRVGDIFLFGLAMLALLAHRERRP